MENKEEKKLCCPKPKLPPMENKIKMKSCIKREKPHPCDPPKPCDPFDDGEGECPKPNLCIEKLNHPQIPWHTRCKPGEKLDVTICTKQDPVHPCDPPLPCVSGNPKKLPCPEVALCIQRVKNPEPKLIRCPSPEDYVSKFLCKPKVDCNKEDPNDKYVDKNAKKQECNNITTSMQSYCRVSSTKSEDGKCSKKCEPKHKEPPLENRIDVKKCTRSEANHPCDANKTKCDPNNALESECPYPNLCVERLKNPMADYQTRCKPGSYLPVTGCKAKSKPPPHPCDLQPPCIAGEPIYHPCQFPEVCMEKVKNPGPKNKCPDPEDMKESKYLCKPFVECSKTPELSTLPECSDSVASMPRREPSGKSFCCIS